MNRFDVKCSDDIPLVSLQLFLVFSTRCTIQARKAFTDDTPAPGVSDEELEAQVIEDSLAPLDDPVESSLSTLVGLTMVKNQIRGLRRTLEISRAAGGRAAAADLPRHLALVGNPGTGKSTVARVLAGIFFSMGAVSNRSVIEVGRDDLVDRKSEARTIFKTRRVLEQASGGVLVVSEAYTLLPSAARPRGRDHGAAALRELARALPLGNPLVILTGAPLDLQRVLQSDIGFKGHFLTRLEFTDPTPTQIARMFLAKLAHKGLVPAEGVTIPYLAELIQSNTEPDWRTERNGKIADLLLTGVRAELRKRMVYDDAASKGSLSPLRLLSPGTARTPAYKPEEVCVTVEDVQNSIVNAM